MQDLRVAIRSLRATPIATAVAVLSLALGIGANSAIFSLVNTLVIRALPVRDPGRLVMMATRQTGAIRPQYSYVTLTQLRGHSDMFDGVLGYTNCCSTSTVTIGADRQAVNRQFVTGDFFTTLGVSAWRGRVLVPADDEPSAPDGPVAVVGYKMWQQSLGGRNDAIGGRLTIDGVLVTVIGVTGPGFFGVDVGRRVDVMIPRYLTARMTSNPFDDDTAMLNVIFRLKQGVSVAAATTALRAWQPQIRAASMPKQYPSPKFLDDPFSLEPAAAGLSSLRQQFVGPLMVLFVLVALVLLIACANIGNLLLARGVARRHELSVRAALGASRWQLARQLLVESLVLATSGAASALLIASWAARVLVTQLSTARTPILLDTAVDWRVLGFTSVVTALTAIVCGTAPALRAAQVAPIDALKSYGRGERPRGGTAPSDSLIVVQVVLALALVVAAGLFAQTFASLVQRPLGFDRDRTIVATVTAPTVSAMERPVFFDRLARAVAAVPGAAAVGGSLNPPIAGNAVGDTVVSAPGVTPPPDAERISREDSITPHWFAAYGIPIQQGRDFDERDTRTTPKVMIVNEAFVRDLFPGRDVVGMPLEVTFRSKMGDYPLAVRTIVGVVGDTVFHSPREPIGPMWYEPLAQRDPIPQGAMFLAVRSTTGSPELLERNVADAIAAFSRDVGVKIEPVARQVDESLASDRVVAILATFFGSLALLLAGLGLYGVAAHSVAERRAEIGIRLALGAAAVGIVRLVVTRMAMLVAAGIGIGAIGALWASRFIASLLYGLDARDPGTFLGATATLTFVAIAAAALPAWRAARLDPAQILRES